MNATEALLLGAALPLARAWAERAEAALLGPGGLPELARSRLGEAGREAWGVAAGDPRPVRSRARLRAEAVGRPPSSRFTHLWFRRRLWPAPHAQVMWGWASTPYVTNGGRGEVRWATPGGLWGGLLLLLALRPHWRRAEPAGAERAREEDAGILRELRKMAPEEPVGAAPGGGG